MPQQLSDTDNQLLVQIAGGDEKAFTVLFNQWSVWLSRYIYRLTDSATLTEEIIQDVFLKIWNNRETLVAVRDFKAFLWVISRNQAYMSLRRVLRERKGMAAYHAQAQQLSVGEDTGNEYFSALDEAIETLSPRAREVYLLSRQERRSYQQIADQLGISKESVKTYLQRATAAITTYIKEKFPELGLIISLGWENFF